MSALWWTWRSLLVAIRVVVQGSFVYRTPLVLSPNVGFDKFVLFHRDHLVSSLVVFRDKLLYGVLSITGRPSSNFELVYK